MESDLGIQEKGRGTEDNLGLFNPRDGDKASQMLGGSPTAASGAEELNQD